MNQAVHLEQVAVALGSNLGESRSTLEQALAMLDSIPGMRVLRRSRWYRSTPIGPVQPDYINGCALLEVALEAETVLHHLLATEDRFGRVRAERWGPRTLDLDLLLMGQQCLDTSILQLPHPRLHERRFVLAPLCELAPEWVHPRLGSTAAQWLARLPSDPSTLND